jgi:hypothetical protein
MSALLYLLSATLLAPQSALPAPCSAVKAEVAIVVWSIEFHNAQSETSLLRGSKARHFIVADAQTLGRLCTVLDAARPLRPADADGDIRMVVMLERKDGRKVQIGVPKFCDWLRIEGNDYRQFNPDFLSALAPSLTERERETLARIKECGQRD